jgi:diguanylate cyclase (GGDEF)-like protein
MKAEVNDGFCELAKDLRAGTWDIVESWRSSGRSDESRDLFALCDRDSVIDELPTLIGGVARVLQNPLYVPDLEPQGSLYLVAQQFGRLRQETGCPIETLLADFSRLRRDIWSLCRESADRAVPVDFFELKRRLDLGVDRLAATAVASYYQHSTAEVMRLSQKDKLTGFLHTKAFGEVLDYELARAKRYCRPLALLGADIDNFRQFNLEEGRPAGNRLLQNVSRELAAVTRNTDRSARVDGDRFILVLPETTVEEAGLVAERLRRSTRSIRRGDLPVTMSIGVAAFPENAEDRDGLMGLVRSALSQSKRDGGNTVSRPRSGDEP